MGKCISCDMERYSGHGKKEGFMIPLAPRIPKAAWRQQPKRYWCTSLPGRKIIRAGQRGPGWKTRGRNN